jgi:hypothetical protein
VGLLLKRNSRFFLEIIATRRFILFAPENADFVGDLLRSFLQKSSISVRSQNPTIPRPEVDYELDLVIYNRPKFESRLEIRLRKF